MTKLNNIQRLIGHGKIEDRAENDFYATPKIAIDALLDRVSFVGDIWEPACGDGAISKVLKERGYDVYSTDLIDRGYGEGQLNFLHNQTIVHDNIVTNPPFNIGTEFTLHALKCVKYKVAIFNKLSFLEGKTRRDKLFSQRNLSQVFVFSQRVPFMKGQTFIKGTEIPSGKQAGGMLAFAWFIFDNQQPKYVDPTIHFI